MATSMTAVLTGKLMAAGSVSATDFGARNRCHPDFISAPDNIRYWAGKLFIGEDTGDHLNDAAWTWGTRSGLLTRIGTVVAGAEWTGTFAVHEEGAADAPRTIYLFANNQHPFGESNSTISAGSIGASLDDVFTAAERDAVATAWDAKLGYQPTAADFTGIVGCFQLTPVR